MFKCVYLHECQEDKKQCKKCEYYMLKSRFKESTRSLELKEIKETVRDTISSYYSMRTILNSYNNSNKFTFNDGFCGGVIFCTLVIVLYYLFRGF